tara:strand:+ start:839 stop:1171 length:333 start_codon:yes stop_codon:yes gene_type:complete
MTIPSNPTHPIRKTTRIYTSKKGKFGYMPVKMVNQTMDKTEKKAYEKELARLNSQKKSLNKYKTPKEKAAIKGTKIFLRRRIKSLSGKSRKKKRTRRRRKKSSGKSRTRK